VLRPWRIAVPGSMVVLDSVPFDAGRLLLPRSPLDTRYRATAENLCQSGRTPTWRGFKSWESRMNLRTRSLLWVAVTAGVASGVIGCGSDQLIDPVTEPSSLLSPRAPSNTNAVALAYNAVRVTWSDNSTNEAGFQIYRSTTGSTGTFSLRATRLANATLFQDAQVAPRTSYCYKVRAFLSQDGTRSYSAFSNVDCATTPASPLPAAPSGAVARPVSSTAVRTNWADKSSNEDGFRIQRSLDAGSTWTTAATVGPNIKVFRDNGRTTEQAVCYRVLAFNEHGNSAASNTDCTIPPAPPGNLTASSAPAGISLTWSDNSAAEDGYEVQRSTDGTTFSTIANLAPNATSSADAGTTSNTTYSYRVRAKKDGGFSSFSNVASAVVAATPPSAPSGTSVRPNTSTQVVVTWTDNSTTEDGFRVERSTDGLVTWAQATSTNPSIFVDGGRTSEQEVCYRVIAFNEAGDSPASNTDCTAPPAGPTELAIGTPDDVGYDVTWRDNSSVEDGYELWLFTYYGGYYYYEPYYYPVSLPANTTGYRVSLSENVYGIVAIKDGGYSDWAVLAGVASSASLQGRVLKAGRPPPSAQRTPPVLNGGQKR
jgi:hypothetical protein